MRKWFGVLLMVMPLVGSDALRQGWERFGATTPVRGSLEVRTVTQEGVGAKAQRRSGLSFAWVEDGAEGLRLSWNRGQVRTLEAERRLQDQQPEAAAPMVDGLAALKVLDVVDQVNMVPELHRALEKGVLRLERRETFQGRPARVLVFDVPLERAGIPERIRKRFKEFQATATLWLTEDGTPLSFHRSASFRGRFLVVPFSGALEEKGSFGVVGDRLILTRFESVSTQSGAGEEGRTEVVRVFSPR